MARGVGGGRIGAGSSGGSRSTSHHRSGGGRGSSSFLGGNRVTSGGSRPSHRPGGYGSYHGTSHHRPPSHRPPHHVPPHHRPPHHSYGHYPHRRTYRRGTGCGSLAALVIVILVVTFVVISEFLSSAVTFIGSAIGGSMAGNVTSGAEYRNKLSSDLVNVSSEWYTDELGWIEYERDLINGMQNFYNKTGIQPYLYLVNSNGTMSMDEMTSFANETYDKLFTDEGHMLLCYFSCKNDDVWLVEGDLELVMGKSTESIMDTKAESIFWTTYDEYYENPNLEIEEFFGRIFSTSGSRIMSEPISGTKNAIQWKKMAVIAVVVVGGIILIAIIANVIKIKIRQKNKEQEKLEKMLNTPS